MADRGVATVAAVSSNVDVLWVSDALSSAERCLIRDQPGARAVQGTAILAHGELPARISYSISTGTDWWTRIVTVELSSGDGRHDLDIRRIGGRWTVDGVHRPDLDSCTSVDLGWTPATNTLPLRAAPIAVGQSQRSMAAWVRFPELDVVASEQTYTRLADDVVRYQSPTFTADLHVTPDDIVTTYGDGLWRAAKLSRRP